MSETAPSIEEVIETLSTFAGTPAELVSLMQSAWGIDRCITVEKATSEHGERPVMRVRFVSLGESRIESLQEELEASLFHFAFWRSIHRGGLVVYEVPVESWNSPGPWGRAKPKPEVSFHIKSMPSIRFDSLEAARGFRDSKHPGSPVIRTTTYSYEFDGPRDG